MCARGPSEIVGGFVAITFDNTEVATKGNLGARWFSRISLMATRTAVYARRPDHVRTAASFEAQEAARRGDDAAEQRTNDTFRRDLAVGIETNCGTVIQVHGPMIEIAVTPVRLRPMSNQPSGRIASSWAVPRSRSAPTVSDLSVPISCRFPRQGEAF